MGGANPKGKGVNLLFWPPFPTNCMKLERTLTDGILLAQSVSRFFQVTAVMGIPCLHWVLLTPCHLELFGKNSVMGEGGIVIVWGHTLLWLHSLVWRQPVGAHAFAVWFLDIISAIGSSYGAPLVCG